MKKTLLFTALLATSFGFSQTELVQNGTADEFSVAEIKIDNIKEVRGNTGDNADAWDMTPPSSVILDAAATAAAAGQMSGVEGELGETSASPYTWSNSDLADWLETNCGDGDEQPGSTSDGNKFAGLGDRGVKINEACRRLYQPVTVQMGVNYTFSIQSRSEAENVPSEVFILNEEITSEVGLDDTATSVDAYMMITNDFNSSKASDTSDTFTTTTFTFTATSNVAVIYVRASAAVDSSHEVFYDNISLMEAATASTGDVFASKFSVYPNPAKGMVSIQSADVELSSIQVFNMLGKEVYASKELTSSVDVSNFAKGMYLLKLNSDKASATKKLIVE